MASLILLAGFCGQAYAQANQAPTVSLTSPSAGAEFDFRSAITLTADAADADGTVTQVRFFQGSTLLATRTQAPYSFTWANVAAGSYNLNARATDNNGVVTRSTIVPITVRPNQAPTVSLTSPAAGTGFDFGSPITLTADAADADGTIARVRFYRGSTLLGTSTQAPYSFTWTTAGAGNHNITARAIDNRDRETISAAVPITVRPNQAPTVSLTSPAAGTGFDFGTPITLTADAADADVDGSITRVRFYRGTTLLGTSTQAPYSFTWADAAAGNHNLTARATDSGGAETTSTVVPITVRANQPPTVSLTSPLAGVEFNFRSTITLTADAADADVDGSITRVRFYQGSTLLGTSTQAPYSFTWANVAAGSYNITARATDSAGAETRSAVVPITVRPNQAPAVILTSPVSGAGFGAPASIALIADAADSDGSVATVAFYNGTTLLSTDTTAPYVYDWAGVTSGTYSITARATDNRGAVTTSSPVSVMVSTPPRVHLMWPSNGDSFIAPATIDIKAFATDPDGNRLWVDIYNGTTLLGKASERGEYSWTGVAEGTYTITAVATNVKGAVTTSAPVTITVNAPANQAPTVALTSPAAGASFTAPASINLTADAADSDGSVASVAFYNGATLLGTDTSAPFNFAWADVPAGTYSLTARATDDDGAVAISAAVSVTVDAPQNQAPTVSLTSPVAGASFTAPANIVLMADSADADGTIASVAFYNGATLLGTDTAAPFNFSWTDVPAGTYSLTARATDDDGATTTSAAVSLIVEAANQVPTVALTGPTAGASFTAPASITLSANASDADGSIASVAFYNGATLLGTDTSAPYSFSWSDVPAGTYSLAAVATDDDGATTTSSAVSVTVNAPQNQAPTVSLTSPAAGTSFTVPASITLTADAADTDGSIASVTFYNGATLLGTDTSAPYSFSWTDVPAGAYSITAVATDDDGATTTSAAVSITVEAPQNQAPTVALTSPAAGASFTAPASITLTADASDTDGTIVSVAFYNGATLLGTDTSAPYGFAWTDVPAGAYSITAVATGDDGATTTSAAVSITVDAPQNQAPTVALTDPAAGASFTALASITLTADAVDTDGTVTSVAFYNGTTLLGTDTSAPYGFNWTQVPAGTYSLTARATDDDGVTTTSTPVSITVTAPQTSPSVSITSPVNNAEYITPANVTVTVDVSGGAGDVSRVEFWHYGLHLHTATTAPFTYTLEATTSHNLQVRARVFNSLGQTAESDSVNLSFVNPEPAVQLTAPSTNSTYDAPATLTLTAQASDSNGTVSHVEFYRNSSLLGADATAPYSYTLVDLPAGEYIFTARAVDDGGATGHSNGSLVRVVNTPETPLPTVSITSPSGAESFVAPATVNLSVQAIAPEGRTIREVLYYINGALVRWTNTPPFTSTWSGSDGAGLGVGTYQVTASAVDDTGAQGSQSAPVTVVVSPDQRPPTVSIASPGPGVSFLAPATVALSANAWANPERSIVSVAYYQGSTHLGTASAAPYSIDWANVAAGSHAVTARVTDSSGAVATSGIRIVEVVGSEQAPTVSILNPVMGSSYTAPATIQMSVRAVAGTHRTIRRVDVYRDGTLLNSNQGPGSAYRWTNVPVGNYSLTAVATDDVGATTTSAPVVVSVVAEAVPARIERIRPAENDVIPSNSTYVDVEAYFEDPQGLIRLARFELTHNGQTYTHEQPWQRTTHSHAYMPYTFLQGPGQYSVVVMAFDAAGTEIARSPVRSFSRSTAPVISVTSPVNHLELAAPASVSVSGNAQLPTGVAGFPQLDRVEVYLGQTLVSANARVGETTQFAYTLTDVPEGNHDIRIRAVSADGAATEEIRLVRVLAPTDLARLYISRPIEGAVLPQRGNSVFVGGLRGQWDALASARLEGVGPSSSTLSGDFFRGSDYLNLGPLTAGNWRVRAVATTNQGATRVTDWVNFIIYRRAIEIYYSGYFSGVPSPGVVWMIANAQDCTGCIEAVEFRNGDTVLARVTQPPYRFNVATLPLGTYSIVARMVPVDASRGVLGSAPMAVTVVANAVPTVSITSPSDGATLDPNQNVSLTATASDADTDGTIASVAFYSGEELLGTRTAAPFSLVWQPQQAGDHVLTARATDNHGAVGISPAVNVRVGGTPPDPDARETITYIHTDLSGSPLAATNANGNVVWKENYRAYGERRLGQPGSEGQRQWFHGKEADASTGLQYFGARYYDPAVGRFMGVDAVTFQEGNLHSFNRYAYGNNNPVAYLDPDGMQGTRIFDPNRHFEMLLDGGAGGGPSLNDVVEASGIPSLSDAALASGIASGAGARSLIPTLGSGAAQGTANAAKVQINPQQQAGHVPGTPQYRNRIKQGKPTSAFHGAASGETATRIAHERGTPVPGRPNVKEYDFGVGIGTGPKGGTQTRVRVHQSPKTGEIHGHPSGPERF